MVFSYKPLSSERSEIRLVRFVDPHAGADAAAQPIRLELLHASLNDSHVQSRALSYAWGDPSQRKSAHVHVDGESLIIGSNLHAALTQLRQNSIRSWLWVDSICIQQSDNDEKTWQVAQIGAIFSQAELVYIWLGLGCEETDLAIDLISRVGTSAVSLGILDYDAYDKIRAQVKDDISILLSDTPQEDSSGNSSITLRHPELSRFALDLLEEPGMTGRSTKLQNGLNEVFQREYWHRIWIIQEVALAIDAVVMCGTRGMPVSLFSAGCNVIGYARTLKNGTTFGQEFGWGLSVGFPGIQALSIRQNRLDGKEPITLPNILIPTGRPPLRPFYSSSDPRDIVFGVLGVITGGNSLDMKADYTKTPAQVFTALTRALLNNREQCFPLQRPRQQFHLGRSNIGLEVGSCGIDLPSWVPDWREVGRRGFMDILSVWEWSQCFAPHGMPTPPPDTTTHCDEDEKLGRLRLYGRRVDVITEVMEPPCWECTGEWTLPELQDPEAYITRVLEFTNLGSESTPGEDHVWRTITTNSNTGPVVLDSTSTPAPAEEIAFLTRKMARREPIHADILTPGQKEYFQEQAIVIMLTPILTWMIRFKVW